MAGPLAMGASGLTFFLAFTLAVPSPGDVASSATPVLTVAAAAPRAERIALPAQAEPQLVPVTALRAPAR